MSFYMKLLYLIFTYECFQCFLTALIFCTAFESSQNNLKFQDSPLLLRQSYSFCDYKTYLCDDFYNPNEAWYINSANFHGILKRPGGIEGYNCKYSSRRYFNPVHPLMCFQYHNSPYLGEFFSQHARIESLEDFKGLLHENNKKSLLHKFKSSSGNVDFKQKDIIQMAVDSTSESMPLALPSDIDGLGHCVPHVPVTRLANRSSKCYHLMSRDTCGNVDTLNLGGFMSKTKNDFLRFPPILSGLSKSTVVPNVKVFCIDSAVNYLSLSKNTISGFEWEKDVNVVTCKEDNLNSFLGGNELCENVVVSAKYVFHLNGSEIHRLDEIFYLANIPTTTKALLSLNSKHITSDGWSENEESPKIYISQDISVKFIQNEKPGKKHTSPKGYKMTDKILISYSKDDMKINDCQNNEACVYEMPKYLSLWTGT